MLLPEYLENHQIKKYQAPTTSAEYRLPFNRLSFKTFEHFCCELVYRRTEREEQSHVSMVWPIGISGEDQGGADIFVQKTSGRSVLYELYEVKRVEEYTLGHYKKAVRRFLDAYESWGLDIKHFWLLVAAEISKTEISLWTHEAQKLSERDITYKIVPIDELNEWTRSFPGLVNRFFHSAWVEQLFGEEAAFHLKRYGEYYFEKNPRWLKYKEQEEREDNDHFVHKNNDVKLEAYLPSFRENSASCCVEFRNSRFGYVQMTLSHLQMLDSLFQGVNTPLSSKQRPFLMKLFNDDAFICDVGNCRIHISENEARSLCTAIDALWKRYIQGVSAIEKLWRSEGFPSRRAEKAGICLMEIKRTLWAVLLKFTDAHCVFDHKGEWGIFDQRRRTICVLTLDKNSDLDQGYHVFIEPKQVDSLFKDYAHPDDDVALFWQAPGTQTLDDFQGKTGPRYYWDALYTHNWLRDKLIPAALEWFESRKVVRKILSVKKRKTSFQYQAEDYLKSSYRAEDAYFSRPSKTVAGLLKISETLQIFFSHHLSGFSIDTQGLKDLYNVLEKVLAHVECDHYQYIAGNLYDFPKVDSMEELRCALSKYAKNQTGGRADEAQVSRILACIGSSLREGPSSLNDSEAEHLLEKLQPFTQLMEEQNLLERQLKRVDRR